MHGLLESDLLPMMMGFMYDFSHGWDGISVSITGVAQSLGYYISV